MIAASPTRRNERTPRSSSVALLLLALAIVVSLLLLGPASAGYVEGEDCPVGAISAIGPVDAQGNGETVPAVACVTP
jgi:hypothetical protein